MPRYLRKFLRNRNRAGFRRKRRQGWMQKPVGWYAKKAFQGVRFLKGLINVEKNFIDVSHDATPGTTPSIACLNPCAQGDDDINRKGDSILAKYITVREEFDMNASSVSDIVRVVYVLDKENRGANPTWADVIDTSSPVGRLNRDNMDRFVILKDEIFKLSPNTPNHIVKWTKKLDFHMKYAGNAGDVTDVRQNAVFRLILATDNTNKMTSYCRSRIAFYDN